MWSSSRLLCTASTIFLYASAICCYLAGIAIATATATAHAETSFSDSQPLASIIARLQLNSTTVNSCAADADCAHICPDSHSVECIQAICLCTF